MPYKDIEKRRQKSREFFKNNRNYFKTKEYKVKKAIYDTNYRKLNKDKIRIRLTKYMRAKRSIDISFKLSQYLRNRIYYALKGNIKSKHTIELLGCSIEQLKSHLEKKFTKGMSWNNYGKWHVDHIKPCASFDLSKASEQRKCFHYNNLQPLWAIENRIKHTTVSFGAGNCFFNQCNADDDVL